MSKKSTTKPFFLMLYGYPGSGKTYFARQFCENFKSAHLQADRIRSELFSAPAYDKQENAIINQIMNYMSEEFLSAGLSVAYDSNALKAGQRRMLKNLAIKNGAVPLTIWFQTDTDSAFMRNSKRDRRKADDKYAAQWNNEDFQIIIDQMQNPTEAENYAVVSGKHLFAMQQSAVVRKLRSLGVVDEDSANSKVIKPGLVNLVPNSAGRVDMTRRNISIRN
jgi:predicted kinase